MYQQHLNTYEYDEELKNIENNILENKKIQITKEQIEKYSYRTTDLLPQFVILLIACLENKLVETLPENSNWIVESLRERYFLEKKKDMEKEKISDREEIRKIVKSFNYNQYENISAEVSEEMDFIDLAIKHYNYDAFAWFLEKTGSSPRLTYFNMNDLLIVIDLCCKGGNLTGFSQTYHMLKKAVSSGYFMDKFQMNYFTEICDKLGRPDLLTEVCSDTGKKNSFSFGEANSFSFGEANSFSFGEANSLSDCKVEKKGKTGKPFFPELGKYDSANDARKITFGDRTYTHSEYQSLLEKEGVDPVLLAEIKNKDRLLTSLGISSEEKVKEEQGEQIIHQVAKEESSEKKDNIFERLAPLYGFCPSDSENMGQAHFQAISEQYSEKPPCFLQLKRDHADKTFRLFFSTIIKSLN